MPYEYKFRVLEDSHNCLSTYQFISEDVAMTKYRKLCIEGRKCEVWPIKRNTDPNRADYEYRMFDIVDLKNQFGMVLCLPDKEPEFHGFRPELEDCFDYVDEYYYKKDRS